MIDYQSHEGVVTLRLNRPERRNALNAEMIRELGAALERARNDDALRCLVLTGTHGHFCAGRELGNAPEGDLPETLAYDEAYSAVFRHLRSLEQPSVAVVDGYAVAGGFTLAMACDFVLATEGARFGAMEMQNGFPAAVNTALLAHLGAPRPTLEWLLTGDLVDARRLYEVGLVNRLVADVAAMEQEVTAFTTTLLKRDPVALRLAKEAFHTARESSPSAALTYGKNLNALLLASGRIQEATEAFKRRRKAKD